jgi:hypothetical protein
MNEVIDGKIMDDVNGNNGKIFNGATVVSDPVRGNVLALDGVNQYILLPDAITKGLNSITISAWYRWTDPDDRHWSRVVDIGSDTNDYYFISPRQGGGNIIFEGKSSVWGTAVDRFEGPDAIFDEWVHVAAVVNNGNVAFYVNGELHDEFGVDMKPSDLGDTFQNYIGRSQFSADAYFMGFIDDVIFYNKALSSAEVLKIMNSDFKDIRAAVTIPAAITPAPDAAAEPEAPAVTPATTTTTPTPRTADTTVILVIICAVVGISGIVILRIRKARAR